MQLIIMMVGKTRSAFIQEGMDFYRKRLQFYHQVALVTVREEKPRKGLPPEQIKEKEAERLLDRFPKPGRIVVLEAGGREFTSEELAGWLAGMEQEAHTPVVFIIGGHLGLAASVLKMADHRLSLSRLTFTHELSRLILLEQLYRVATIKAGHPYHN
ncbi:MAG: 23S rRNA (pseudouridine(1915)-N(3))-methyltransferase RlmH [Deltaproteobacteria bacterium]|nr:23S rRNA (pseudouridine(1915)-N(3))-methyltransferase RlmH [Deltaproteobacteria bacterium]